MKFYIFLLHISLSFGRLIAQEAILEGKIYNLSQLIVEEEVQVVLLSKEKKVRFTYTDYKGNYAFGLLDEGYYHLRLIKAGFYISVIDSVWITENTVQQINYPIQPNKKDSKNKHDGQVFISVQEKLPLLQYPPLNPLNHNGIFLTQQWIERQNKELPSKLEQRLEAMYFARPHLQINNERRNFMP